MEESTKKSLSVLSVGLNSLNTKVELRLNYVIGQEWRIRSDVKTTLVSSQSHLDTPYLSARSAGSFQFIVKEDS